MISDPAALAAEISDAETPPQRLVEIAGSFPEFGPVVAEHPNASLDVLSFLLKHGDESTRKAAARRRARDVAQITMDASQAVIAKPVAQTEGAVKTPVVKAPEVIVDGGRADAIPVDENASSPEVFRAAEKPDEEFDRTVISQREAPKKWRIVIDGQDEIALTSTDLLVGRKPSFRPEFGDAQLVTITDPTKTVSKTHARMILRDDTWFIVDLSSTNGVFLETSGSENRVVAETEIAIVEAFSLGDLRIRLISER